jgi:threonine dehydrogenase-like Zn-dependent dehydrogenase
MSNPWLSVPLSEYEQHMSSEEVRQLAVLSELFAEAIARCRPSSIAVLGIAGGNGLEHIDGSVTTRIVGVDLNPQYIESVRRRYSHLPGLDLCCVNLSEQSLVLEPVQLVHAALIFEHAGVELCLENAIALTAPGGNLSVVLQLPAESGNAAGASLFASIENLHAHFSFVRPAALCESLAGRGFRLARQTTRELPAGKAFWAGIFAAPEAPHQS